MLSLPIVTVAAAAPWIIAATADPGTSIWQVAAQSGFNAVLVLVLLYYGRLELKEIRREMREQRKTGDRNTKLVTIALLQLATLLPGVRGQLQGIKDEIEETEKADHRPPADE